MDFSGGVVYSDDSFCTSRTGLFEENQAANYPPPVLNVKPNELWLEPNEQRGGRDVAIMKPLDSG